VDFTLTVPDELIPALVAEFSLVKGSTTASSPEEYFTASVIETVRQRAELYKVGPYFTGAVNPQFRQDGMPFDYVEPVPEDVTEPGFEVNDTTTEPEVTE